MDFLRKVVCLVGLVFIFLFLQQNLVFAEPNMGDGIYRDMAVWWSKPTGHAGLSIGNKQVIHMQETGCCLGNFSDNFSKSYWGAITQGNSSSCKMRVNCANDIYKYKHPKYSFWNYKSYPNEFRCDGLVEYCFEKAGGDIVPDWGWATVNPYIQWISKKVTRYDITELGKFRLQ